MPGASVDAQAPLPLRGLPGPTDTQAGPLTQMLPRLPASWGRGAEESGGELLPHHPASFRGHPGGSGGQRLPSPLAQRPFWNLAPGSSGHIGQPAGGLSLESTGGPPHVDSLPCLRASSPCTPPISETVSVYLSGL